MEGSTRRPAAQEVPTAELVKQLSEQISVLMRDELKLARLEMTRKGKQAGLGAGLFGASGVAALYGIGCLLAAAILGISRAMPGWLAALIVGVAVLAISAAVALAGKGRLRKAVPPVPRQAAEGIKADVEEIKEGAHR
ncbi:MAG: phage holin family protein [Streptosporangiaceae bacterium]|jgi:putative superfamily III holin-X